MRVAYALLALQAVTVMAAPFEFNGELPKPPERYDGPWLPYTCGFCPENHHCLKIPNGYETCVWEGYHTREYCVSDGKKHWKREDALPVDKMPPRSEAVVDESRQHSKFSTVMTRIFSPDGMSRIKETEAMSPMQASTPAPPAKRHVLEPRFNFDPKIPTIECTGKYNICAELMPSDGTMRGFCIDKPFWMQWDACRNYQMGHKESGFYGAGRAAIKLFENIVIGQSHYKGDDCSYMHY